MLSIKKLAIEENLWWLFECPLMLNLILFVRCQKYNKLYQNSSTKQIQQIK